MEALGSTCVGAWASRGHGSCYRHRAPESAGNTSPEGCLLVLGYLEPWQLLQMWGTKPSGSRSSGACFPCMSSWRVVQ
jgi:hypothetical protein